MKLPVVAWREDKRIGWRLNEFIRVKWLKEDLGLFLKDGMNLRGE